MVNPAGRRSACDQCRARRVQCLRAHTSTAPCARCSHTGARCVTSAPGRIGRPRKTRPVDGDTPPRGPGPSFVEVHALALPVGEPAVWATPGDSSVDFHSPSLDESPPPGEDILALGNQLSSPSQQLQGLLSADDELGAMLHVGQDFNTALDMEVDPLLAYPWPPLPQCPSPASSLVRFREEIDQHITAMDVYYSNPLGVLQDCKEELAGRGPDEHPAVVLITSTKNLIDIIQSLTPAGRTTGDTLSTEIVLLALSGYLSLMRLFDDIFHTIHTAISQMPPDSFKCVKVKSVLRIGGISALQDLPLKTYATGIVDAIQGQVRTLERCMGIPAEYCLSGEAATATPAGMLSRADRAQLFWAVVEQEDVKSWRGGKSYVESIRGSIRASMGFFDD